MMKAAILPGKDEPILIKEVIKPNPRPLEVQVQLTAAALNHRDVWIQRGKYAKINYPIILGSDGAGVIAAVGAELENDWLGKKVLINPGINWGSSNDFQSRDFRILGMPDNGTFAQFVTISIENIFSIPRHLSFAEAAALPLAGITAYRALFTKAHLKNGDKVLITGIGGGVAQVVQQFALAAGAQVFVTSGDDEKIEKSKALGAEAGVNYHQPDWDQQLKTHAGSFDVIIDSAGGQGFAKLAELAAPGGRISLYGGTTGPWQGVVPQRIFWKQLTITGTTMGTPAEFKSMLQFVEQHKIKPVIDKIFPLEEAEQAMRRLEAGRQLGKIVLHIQ